MEINLLNRVSPLIAMDASPKLVAGVDPAGPVVTAVRALNKSELFGNDRELQFTRDTSTRTVVIQVVNRATGDVIEQIPPEQILQMMADLTKKRKDTPVL